jgi:tetratricopeptide (TPR) repeat protein
LGYVLLPVDYPNRYLGLIAELYRSPDFRLVFSNGSEVLFARRDLAGAPALDLAEPEQVATLARSIHERYAGQPKLLEAALLHLATLEITLGELERAREVLQPMQTPAAAALVGRVHYLLGDLGAAEASARQALRRDPEQSTSLTLLSRIALERGRMPEASRYLRRSLQSDPFDVEATQLLTRLEATEP